MKPAGKRPDFGPPGERSRVHDESVTTLIYSADGSLAASGSEDISVIIWQQRAQNGLKVTQSGRHRYRLRARVLA